MQQISQQEREIAHWKEWQQKADTVWGWQTPAGQRRADRRTKLFLELAHIGSDSKVLELGCGTGEFSQRMAGQVQELWATDLSPELLHRAEERVRSVCPRAKVNFALQDATQLTLPEATFDAVYGCSVLHHIDAARALRETWRVLMPGGWCVFSEPNMLNPQILLQKNLAFFKRHVGDTEDETAFFRGQMERWLRAAGYVQVTVRYFDFLHPMTPRFLLAFVDRLGRFVEECPIIRSVSGSLILSAQKPAVGGS